MKTLVLIGLFGLGGCIASEMPADHICDEVAYAVSSRAFSCTGDADKANDIFDEFVRAYECQVEGYTGSDWDQQLTLAGGQTIPVEEAFGCPDAIRAAPCGEVAPDAFDELVALGVCARLVAP